MVGLIVGLLVRHLADAKSLLDGYLTEPLIWHYEFARVVHEASGFAADSEGLATPERRNWSLREAAMFLVLRANRERAAELRALGETLVANARRLIGNDSDHTPFRDGYYGDMALAALIPNATGGLHLYREVDDTPIAWWDPLELASEVEAWLVPAAGNAMCVNQLLSFVSALGPDDQVRLGLPWVAKLVVADPIRIASGTYALTPWLIEMRSVAVDAELLNTWQRVVDDLVVAGVTRLAPYSD